MQHTKHIPVLLQESLSALGLQPGQTVVDATFGGGGHSREILQAVGETGRVIAFDRDQKALEAFESGTLKAENLTLVHANYSEIEAELKALQISQVDAVFADLGFSSDQIEAAERGLSFLHEGPLDMRMDQSETLTAAEVVNTFSEEKLKNIFQQFGEEPRAGVIAQKIVSQREKKLFETTKDLAVFLEQLFPRKQYGKSIHPATKVFQALRISVNQEREHLARFLESTVRVVAPGGKIAIISFHSGEDRMVKDFFKKESNPCECPKEFPVCRCGKVTTLRVITRKPLRPSEQEVLANPRSRSALLRVAEKI